MKIHFIGAGPGAADLITVRGRDLIAQCPVCLYAGSLVPKALLEYCPEGARLIDTAYLSLDEIEQEYINAYQNGQDVARLHSGDLSVFSAIGEQIRRLNQHDIPWDITPGVPAFAAASALLGCELTLPSVAQSVVLTRISGRASSMPEKEKLENFAKTGATLVLHLAIHRLNEIVDRLMPYYGAQCPIAIVARASWPNEIMMRGTLETIKDQFAKNPVKRTALIIVGPALSGILKRESALYDPKYHRRFRP